ncbi:MAG: hypothetical protein OXC92_07360 [Flavobacteriaceae bacterium]|nr:hypothetical protein [Flavobacteriaceae bacterium]MCY4253976.1 hypothetical protein [Flavobacteriaceae bacterium]
MLKAMDLSQIKYDDAFQGHHYIWDYRTDNLTLEAKELIIPRVLRHPSDFDKNLRLLETYYTEDTIYNTLKNTR